MQQKYGLVEHRLPSPADDGGAKTTIFTSPDIAQRDHVLLLIQGSGGGGLCVAFVRVRACVPVASCNQTGEWRLGAVRGFRACACVRACC
jgi:hypothetical protein